MPISAPQPSWASIKNKPTTIAGFGISDVNWTNLQSKPTTVSGFGISDFSTQALNANANAAFGGVGTYVFAQYLSNLGVGATIAGGNLKKWNGASWVGMGLSGTWKLMGHAEDGGTLLFVRIA